jgi:hypothetical protein
MKNLSALVLFGVIAVPGPLLGADQNVDVDALKREIRELRERTEQLEKKLDQLQSNAPPARVAVTNAMPSVAATQPSPSGSEALTQKWSPTEGITLLRSGRSYMNIGFDALLDVGGSTASDPSAQLELGDHDPIQRGFSMRNAEISLDGAVDPYFSGFANFVFKLDKDNETEIEAEEVYAKTTSLPGNIQLRAGQYFANFGRQNSQHPHAWAFVDAPLILTRTLGPEGLRGLGAEISWLAPTPFFAEATLSVMNGNGSQGFLFRNSGDEGRFRGRQTTGRDLRGPGDLIFVPRISSSFDITDTQTLLVGTSAAFGPNETGTDERTQVYGADIFWKWKSPHADKGFPFVAFQTEGIISRFEAGEDPLAPVPLAAETLYDYGFYSQVLWGFKPGWVAALRGEWVDGDHGADDPNDPFRNQRTRISPNLTWYPTEFSKVRLQYNYDNGELFGDEHSVWLQFEFQLGAHAAHKF